MKTAEIPFAQLQNAENEIQSLGSLLSPLCRISRNPDMNSQRAAASPSKTVPQVYYSPS